MVVNGSGLGLEHNKVDWWTGRSSEGLGQLWGVGRATRAPCCPPPSSLRPAGGHFLPWSKIGEAWSLSTPTEPVAILYSIIYTSPTGPPSVLPPWASQSQAGYAPPAEQCMWP